MSTDQILGIVRHVVAAGGALLIQHGVATASQANDLEGGVLALIMILWSVYEKKESVIQAKSAAIDDKNAAKPVIP